MSNVPKMFGSLVFNETVMKDRLPTATYKTFKNAVLKGMNCMEASTQRYRNTTIGGHKA